MRKELVYSLLAVAAIPNVVHADALIKVDIKNWTGTGAELGSANTKFISNSGETITISIGKLVKGDYILEIKDIISTLSPLTISVGDNSVTIDANKTKAELKFILTAETDVTIKVASSEKQRFEIGATTITLKYNFKEANQDLTKKLQDVTDIISEYKSDKKDDYLLKAIPIQKKIDSLEDNLIDGSASYEAYKNYGLYNGIDKNNPLVKEINALLNDAAHAVKLDLVGKQEDALSKAKDDIEAIEGEGTKEFLLTAIEDIEKKIAAFKAGVEAKYKEGNAAEFDSDNTALKEIQDAITALNTSISTGVTNNYKAWTQIQANISNAKGKYLSNIVTNLQDGKDQIFTYGNLLEEGRKIISDNLAKLGQIEKDAEASYKAGTLVEDRKDVVEDEKVVKQGYDSQITQLGKDIKEAYTLYAETLKSKLSEFENTYKDQQKKLTDAKTTYKDVIGSHPNELKALEEAVAAVKSEIDKANTGDCKALESLTLTALTGKVDEAVTALVNACGDAQDKINAVNDAKAKLKELDDYWKTAKEAISKLKYGDKDVANYFKEIPANIDKAISAEYDTAAKNEKDNNVKGDDTYYKTTLDSNIGTIQSSIDTYKEDATNASTHFNDNVYTPLTTAKNALAGAKALVVNEKIYTINTWNKDTYNYKEKVEKAEAIIKTAEDKIEEALKLFDKANVDAVKALPAFVSTEINNVVTHIDGNYQADIKKYEEESYKKTIQDRKDAALNIRNGLATDKETISAKTKEQLGKGYTEISSRLAAFVIPTEAEVNTAINSSDEKELLDMIEKLLAAKEEMETIKALVALAEKSVEANTKAKTAADEDVNSLNWDAEKGTIINNAKVAYTDNTNAYDNGTIDEKKTVDDLIDAISKEITDINTAIGDSYKDENLKDDYESTLKGRIAAVKTSIEAAKKTATALSDNYKAFKELTAEIETVDINTAQEKAIKADPNAGKDYYSTILLNRTYADELESIRKDISTKYTEKTAEASKKNLLSLIEDLKKKIATVEQAVKDNKASYDEVQKIEDEVTTTWNNKSEELAKNNESSKLKEYQATLDDLLAQLNAQIDADKKAYEGGKSVENQTDAEAKLALIKKSIEDLVTEAMEGYDKQIATDNDNMLAAIATEKGKAQALLKSATETLYAYKNVKSEKAKATLALEAVKTAYSTVNDNLYEIPTNIKDTWDKAEKAYYATKSPTVFDKDSSYVKQFRTYAETINNNLTSFLNAAKKALNISDYTKQISDQESVVKGYKLTKDENKSKVFDALKAKVAEAETAMTAPDIAALDATLVALESFKEELKAALNAAAKLDLEPALKDAEADVEKGKAFFADDEEKLTSYQNTDVVKIEEARTKFDASTDLSKDYNEISGLITTYNDNNQYKTANDKNAAYEEVMKKIAEQKKVLKDAIAAIQEAGYGCIEMLKTQTNGFNDIATEIDNLVKKAEAKKAGEAGSAYPTDDEIKAITTKVNNVIADDNLKTKEKAYLDDRIGELQAEYNRFAGKSSDAEAVAAQKKTIDDLVKAIDDDNKDAKKTAKDLLAYEAKIKEALANLVKANDGDAAMEGYRTNLIKSLDEVAAKAVFAENVNAAVKTKYEEDMAAIVTQIANVRKEIEASENPAFDSERINNEIEALNNAVEALNKKIEAEDETAKKAYNTKLAELEGYEALIAASKTKLDEYTEATAKSENFAALYKIIEDKIAAAKTKNEELAAEGNAVATVDTDLKNTVTDRIAAIEDAAANRQVNAELKDLQAKFAILKAIVINESNYTPTDLKTINDNKTDIDKRINGTYDAEGKLTKNGLVQDIQSDLNKAESAKNLATRQTEIADLIKKIEETTDIINDGKIKPEPEIIPGDITGTGEVTDDDVEAMIKKVADLPADFEPTEQELALLDVNGDGKVNIGDVIATYNVSVGLNWDGSDPDYTGARQKAAENAEQGNVSIEATGMGNGVTRLVLTLDSPMEFIAFQTDVLLANGVKIVGEQLSEAAQGLTLTTNDVTDTRHRVMGYSFSSSINNGAVLQIDVEGDGAVAFDDIYFTTRSAKTYKFEVNGITGISTVSADTQDKTVYDLRGKVVKSLKKGVNLVRDAFGNVKKILVK